MLAQDKPGAGTPDKAHGELVATVDRLTEAVLDLVAEVPGSPDLPLPEGWRAEDIAYPPPWARQLPWKGDIQIRFPPGWFDPKSPTFWSYPVLYRLEGDVLSTRDDLEKALRAYDAGLYAGAFEASKIAIEIGEDQKADRLGHPVVRRPVTLAGFDPFATKRGLTTHLDVFRWYCPESRKTEILILPLASPPRRRRLEGPDALLGRDRLPPPRSAMIPALPTLATGRGALLTSGRWTTTGRR